MNFMVYLNGVLQSMSSYTIDVDGNITVVNWRGNGPSLSCNPGDIIAIIYYEGGVVTKRTDNVCNAYVQLGETPTYSSTETEIF